MLERALAILDVLAEAPHDLGTNEIARRVDATASSVSRMLTTLAAAEVVHRVPDTGRYRLGLRLVQLGNAAISRFDLRALVRPHLVDLAETTGETATLSVPGEAAIMTLDFEQSPSSVRSVAEVGRPSVSHATAVGKVYLSHGGSTAGSAAGGPAQVPTEELISYTDRTVTDPDTLASILAEVRERGWAEAIEEREPGLNAVAVPVLTGAGALVAVLGVQGPAWRFEADAMTAAVEHLREHAATVAAGAHG